MPLLQTTDTLVEEVRSLTNEINQDSLQTARDILPALNRAQEHMMSILAKHYPEPYLVEHIFDVVGGQAKYEIPENAWSDQVTKIEMLAPNRNYRYEVERANYRDATKFRSDSQPNTPYYYTIHGRDIEFIPEPAGTYDGVMWYVRAPELLVLQQGRITLVDAANNRIKVDAIDTDEDTGISTETDNLKSWVNIVDGQTGEIKATCQIKTISGTQDITFKSNTDDTILNRTVTKDLTTVVDADGNLDIQKNDYICHVQGTCVPYFFQPARNFIVSHASADCSRAIGVPSNSMYREKEKFEKEIRSAWTGREARLRIKNKSPHWSLQRYTSRYRR
jgi:hypothetical protein